MLAADLADRAVEREAHRVHPGRRRRDQFVLEREDPLQGDAEGGGVGDRLRHVDRERAHPLLVQRLDQPGQHGDVVVDAAEQRKVVVEPDVVPAQRLQGRPHVVADLVGVDEVEHEADVRRGEQRQLGRVGQGLRREGEGARVDADRADAGPRLEARQDEVEIAQRQRQGSPPERITSVTAGWPSR